MIDNKKRLQELYDNNIPVYSISRLDTINRCLYEAYLTYIQKERQSGNVYSILGSCIHSVLEGITNGTATEADLYPAMQEEFKELEMLDIEFPKTSDGRDVMRNNWVADMTHFCKTYKAPQNKTLKAEEMFIYQTPAGKYLQGYIDLYMIRKDGSIDIFDYKTSTLYSGKDIKEHGRQLITYVLGKRQEGFKVNSASWIFLKYVTVKFNGKKTSKSKKESEIVKNVERRKLASEIGAWVEADLLDMGLNELDVEIKMDEFRRTNMIPDELKEKYVIKPCVISVDLSEESINECIEYIDSTIERWESMSGHEIEYTPVKFTKLNRDGKEVPDHFFCSSLCGHSNHCHYYQDFLRTWQPQNNDDDLF